MSQPNEKARKGYRRLPGYDYSSSGAYSFTSCTRDNYPFFEDPDLAQVVLHQWEILPQRYSEIALDQFVIMSDHIHGIVWIHEHEGVVATLSRIVGSYKSLVCKQWRDSMRQQKRPYTEKIWQLSFHDHIVRNEKDLQVKQQYIANNPLVETLKKEQIAAKKMHQRNRYKQK